MYKTLSHKRVWDVEPVWAGGAGGFSYKIKIGVSYEGWDKQKLIPYKKPKPEKCTLFKGENVNLIKAMHKPSLNHFPNTLSNSSVLTDNFFLL